MNYQQLELFNKKTTLETPAIEQGDVKFYPYFFNPEISDFFYQKLYQEVKWEQKYITLYGKTHPLPRLTAWYGDEGKIYTYSNITMYPQPWTDSLLTIKNALKNVTEAKFNSVLLNLYRHGQDSMGWHSDDEKELGKKPVIASVNFGQTRRFMLKPRDKNNHTKFEFNLGHGSVLIMAGETQKYWLHQIPKTTRELEPRINLTFRFINH